MPNFSLFQRLTREGTITEPNGNPNPQYSLPSTVNWMRSLAMVASDTACGFSAAEKLYANETQKKFSNQEANSVMEHILFALHQLAALNASKNITPKADIARVAVVAWYYGVYWAAKAMIAASDCTVPENHAKTANSWLAHFPARNRTLPPFALFVNSLAIPDANSEIERIKKIHGSSGLVRKPATIDEAQAMLCGYLSGTVDWTQWKKSEEIKKKDPVFKSIRIKGNPVNDFKGKEAKNLRDSRLRKQGVGFMHQAFRYRGKANYREGLYLAHGSSVESNISGFTDDLYSVAKAFVEMAGAYAAVRLGKPLWHDFVADIEKNRSFSISPKTVFT